jgi:putative DNA primase/helicase
MPPHRPTVAEREAAAAADFQAITTLRLRLHQNGYSPVPVTHPDVDVPSAGKAPRMSNWQERCPKATPADIMLYPKQYPDHTNTGISCDKIVGVDIDIPDPEIVADVYRCIGLVRNPRCYWFIG